MLRLRKLQLLYKGILPFGLVAAATVLIWREQGSYGDGIRSVPWSEWILLLYGLLATLAGLKLLQARRASSSRALSPQPADPAAVEAQHAARRHHERQQEEVTNLSDNTRKLEEKLRSQANRLKPYMIFPLLHEHLNWGDMIDQLESTGCRVQDRRWYAVLSLQIEPLEQTRFGEKDRGLLYFSIQNMIEELIPESDRLAPILVDRTVTLLVMHDCETKEAFRGVIEDWITAVQTSVFHYIRLKTRFGVSTLFEHVKECPAAFRESVQAINFHSWPERARAVFYFEAMPKGQSVPFPEAHPLETEWLEAVKTAEAERAGQVLNQMIRDLFQPPLHPLALEMSLIRLLLTFLDHIKQWGVYADKGLPMPASLFQEVLALRNAGEAERWFRETLMDPSLHAIQGTVKSHKRHLLERIVNMIQEEYDTELSLESVAGRLQYNANYLSGLFNKEMNITFSEYLAKYRHDKARKWLVASDIPVKEIAQRLQYKNSQNFIRSFRRSQDMTPGEYRLKFGRKPLMTEAEFRLQSSEEQVQET